MKLILLLFLIFSFFSQDLYGQKENINSFAQDAFESEYKKRRFKRFNKNRIKTINDVTIKFGKKILIIHYANKSIKQIFEKGIFNPDVVFGKRTTGSFELTLLMPDGQEKPHSFSGNDSLLLHGIEEMKELNPNPQTKRYIFWLYRKEVVNPTEYYFEIYNKKASEDSTMEEFLKNAYMTFYYKGTIRI